MKNENSNLDRRSFIRKTLAVSAGTAAVLSLEEKILLAQSSIKPNTPAPAGADIPLGKIGKIEISRLICGGNLIGGYAHSRSLVYVSTLFKHYFTEEKICETLQICEANGINTIISSMDEMNIGVMSRYFKNGGKIQWIPQIRPKQEDPLGGETQIAFDNGICGVQIQGARVDKFVESPEGIEAIRKIIESAKGKGLIAGLGAHKLETVKICEKEGIDNDFYMKTLHHHKYYSMEQPDVQTKSLDEIKGYDEQIGYWCTNPEETAEFMKGVKKPWIAFKVLAAGAISPTSGFKYVLQSGADFMCVGMFDFQVADDAAIVKGLFARGIERERPWMA